MVYTWNMRQFGNMREVFMEEKDFSYVFPLHNDTEGKQVVVVVSGKAQYETRAVKQAFPYGEFGIITHRVE